MGAGEHPIPAGLSRRSPSFPHRISPHWSRGVRLRGCPAHLSCQWRGGSQPGSKAAELRWLGMPMADGMNGIVR
jgi:hypothetical protein